MSSFNKPWMAVMAAVLLVGILVGVVWARPNDRPGTADITRKVTLTGADFNPREDGIGWYNGGGYIQSDGNLVVFTAPVVFPCLSSVTVERVKLHLYDNNAAADIDACAILWRAAPEKKGDVQLGGICSLGTTTDPQTLTSTAVNKAVWPTHRAYIVLGIRGSDIKVYGVTVEYHRNT